MPTLAEWVAGKTADGKELPADKVAAYRAANEQKAGWSTSQPSRGLGDTIARFTHATGLDKVADTVAKAVGAKGCGCNKRQEALNNFVPYKVATLPVSVAIISHNYGRFLQEAIDSVRLNTPAEIVVIDDSSTDETREVAERNKLRYIRHEGHDVFQSRQLAFSAMAQRYVVFLDADDKLPEGYLKNAVEMLDADSTLGIVYSDLQHFGDSSGYTHCGNDGKHIEHENYIHAGSVARRAAIEMSGHFRRPGIPQDINTQDWILWRDVMRCGWKAAKNPHAYMYRKHGESMMARQNRPTYYDAARLADETVTIVVPLSGRDTSKLWDWLLTQTWPREKTRLLFVDTVREARHGAELAKWLPYRNVSCLQLPVGRRGLADEDRKNPQTRREVQSAVAELYAKLRNEVATEYCLILEDDVTPDQPDAIEQLMRQMDERTAAVSGVYWSRYMPSYLAWDRVQKYRQSLGTGVETVHGTGFGCLLLRRSVWQEAAITTDGTNGDYDPAFFDSVAELGFSAKINWHVLCDHAGLKALEPWRLLGGKK